METKINIAEILKNKPQGTKLYDLLYNIDVELDTISTTDTETVVWCTNKTDNNTTCHRGYSEFGTVRGCFDGLQILLPSKEMRDWGKFTWKKGDVLVHKDGDVHIIFERFVNDTYCSFVGKYYLWKENNDTEQFYKNERLLTSDFQKAGKAAAQTYISTIEERLGGKLNRETLKIEKPEFKDGDVLFVKCKGGTFIEIFNYSKKNGDLYDHVSLDIASHELDISGEYKIFKENIVEIRLATKEEKLELFKALAKENKAWDSDKKQIVDLKPNVELKPFDKVLVRDSKSDNWRANLFGYIDEDEYYHCVYANWVYCIPYAGNESLLGTTKDVEG
jgi:hypothetical protein